MEMRRLIVRGVSILAGVAWSLALAAGPSTPASVGAQVQSSGIVELHWSASSSDGYVAGYEVVRNGTVIWYGGGTSYNDSSAGNGQFNYYVRAVDGQGNRSGPSATISVTISGSSVVTSISTPNSPNTGECVDEDGDGYGWNGYATCDPYGSDSGGSAGGSGTGDAACEDPDGDGYGWNGYETCDPAGGSSGSGGGSSEAACVDSDGDGYGWNGYETCDPDSSAPVDSGSDGENGQCDYSASEQNNGHGWNSTLQVSCPPQ